MSNFPSGLSLLQVRRRAGKLKNDYEIVLSSNVVYSNFPLFADYTQTEVKNIGQVFDRTIKSEVYILRLLESKNQFTCNKFVAKPALVNDVPYSGKAISIPFSSIGIIVKENGYANIYAYTGVVDKQIAVKYSFNTEVWKLWYYIKYCKFPPAPYYGGVVLGGVTFLNL